MEDNATKLINQLKRHEGNVAKNGIHSAYEDHLSYLTIGYGRLIDPRMGAGLTDEEAEYLLMKDVSRMMETAQKSYSWYGGLNEPRKAVIINMLFNLGQPRFDKFKMFQDAIRQGFYETAAAEMLRGSEKGKKSLWYEQVGKRAEELSEQMRTGKWQ